jgi:FKBP-type peptidyl-prolyl cis-trans isomerase 2
MKEGDFIRIDYIARLKENNSIFDLTREDIAKRENIFNPNFKYGPIPVIIGAGLVIPGLEEELKKMKVKEKKTFVVKPEKAFGQRSPELIKLIPLTEFKRKNIDPHPGMIININNIPAKVLSVTGGRVRVDFNHPLAGKELEYEVEIVEKITEKDEKVKAVLEYFLKVEPNEVEVKFDEKSVEIAIKKKLDIPIMVKERIAKIIKRWIKGIERVRFVETF